MIKRQFGCVKTRFRSLVKSTAQLFQAILNGAKIPPNYAIKCSLRIYAICCGRAGVTPNNHEQMPQIKIYTPTKSGCSGQLIPDTMLSFSSARAGASPPLN